jgi:hypothetical protein
MDTPNPYFNSDLGAPEGSFWLAGISEAWEPELLQVLWTADFNGFPASTFAGYPLCAFI